MVSFKSLQSSSANEITILATITLLLLCSQGKLESTIKEINLKPSFDLNEKSFFTRWNVSALSVALCF